MARDEAPPFARGETYYNGSTKDPIFSDPINILGKEYVFEPNSPDGQATGDLYGRPVRVRVVQNESSIALKPARLAHFAESSSYGLETTVDGYTFALADRVAGVVDDLLPPAGVPVGDLFYLIIDGPTSFTQLHTSASVLAIGSRLVPGAGTGRTNDDSGRVALQDLTGATATLAENILNQVGYAAVADNSNEDAVIAGVVHTSHR